MLADDHLRELVSSSNAMAGNYRYRLTSQGIDRVKDALERSRYAGPAPVTIEQYIEVMEQQRAVRPHPSRESIEAALSEPVLAPEVADNLARSLHSGRCMLLYGPSGNGKTMVLEAFARHLEGTVGALRYLPRGRSSACSTRHPCPRLRAQHPRRRWTDETWEPRPMTAGSSPGGRR
jgi:hypothetical protein